MRVDLDLDRLEALAKAADDWSQPVLRWDHAQELYRGAADPKTVLALIAALRAALAANEER